MNKKIIKNTNPYTSWAVYLRLLKSASPYWLFFVIGIIGTILATGIDSGLTWAIKPLMNNWNLLFDHGLWWVRWLVVLIIVVFSIRSIAYFLSNYFLSCVGRNVVRDFRQKIFAHLMHLPASYYDQETSGNLLSTLVYNTEQVAVSSTEALLTLSQEGLLFFGLIITMFILSWQLTIIFMITAPIVSAIIRYSSKRLRHLSSNVQKSMGNLTHIAEEGIENYKVVRIFGGESYEKEKFSNIAQQNRQREVKVVATSALSTSLTQFITSIPIALIVYIAIIPSLHIDFGSFGGFVFAALRILTPLRRLTKINTEIQKGVANAHSIFTLLDQGREKDTGIKTIKRVSDSIEYRNVTFYYPNTKKAVLHDINLKVEAGQNIALVGRSGGGKSTLVGLLPRFYDVTSGEIMIDGVNIQKYKLTELRKQVSIVSQHLTLFNDTIARNIAYGSLQDANIAKIEQAAAAAHILEFIKTLPEGLNTMIGENGLLLSGGQRQRIAIARALLKNAPILILDEATSALDTESEQHIQAALEILMRNRTTLVIAHRLSTIERADKIIVLDNGKIVESGTHHELLKLNGQYAKLYKMQFKIHS